MDVLTVERLCEEHRDLPRRVASYIAATLPAHVTADELEPAAWDGLYRAAVSWRPDGGVAFPRWAWHRAGCAIRDHLRADDLVPRRVRAAARAAHDARDRLRVTLGRDPSHIEIAAAAGLRRRDYEQARVALAGPALPPVSVDAGPWLLNTPAGGDGLDDEVEQWTRAAITALPDRHRAVMTARVDHDTPHRDLAAELGVGESRVSQIFGEAIAMVADAVRFHVWDDPGRPAPAVVARRRDRYRAAVAALHQQRHIR